MSIEYRICWTSSANITFRGHSDWVEVDDEEGLTQEQVEDDVSSGKGELSEALDTFLNVAGIDLWVEFKE